jgi:3-methylfumaryl-CoA hydratase
MVPYRLENLPRIETRTDQIAPGPAAALSATLDRDDPPPQPGDELPPLWHWLYFLPLHRQSGLGEDGHAKLGGFLPETGLPHRMWAGSRLQFHRPLRIGETVTRTSRVASLVEKQGRTGRLVFVTVRHEIGDAVSEEQSIVYRGHAATAEPTPAPTNAAWQRRIHPDDVLLFRYSALTFNAHRIHYDRRFATEISRYPGLVVHGPLIATLLLDLVRRNLPEAKIRQFEFRAVRALFDTADFYVCGRPDGKLWAHDAQGNLCVEALFAPASPRA